LLDRFGVLPTVEKLSFVRRHVGISCTGKLTVASLKKYQWPTAIDPVIVQGRHAADENFVVAAVKPRVSLTFENDRRVRKHWDTGIAR
jgi:hypothetical protein